MYLCIYNVRIINVCIFFQLFLKWLFASYVRKFKLKILVIPKIYQMNILFDQITSYLDVLNKNIAKLFNYFIFIFQQL